MDTSVEQHLLHRENPLGRGQSVVFPDYAEHCIANVPALIGSILGVNEAPLAIAALGERFHGYERVVFLILDGLGYRKAQALFQEYPGSALRSLGESGCQVPLTSVYPSTTVSALTSLSTGLTPLEHGMIGYSLYLRETASITNMIRFTTLEDSSPESAFATGLDRETLIPNPTVHERLDAQGISAHSILPSYIATSGLSTVLYQGCKKMHSAVSLPDMLARAREILRDSAGKTFVSLYWPGLDSVAHIRGPNSESYHDEFCAVDDAIRRGLMGQIEDTLLVVTSDHGFVPMAPEDYVMLNGEFDADRTLLMPPVGEPRASYLFVNKGHKEIIKNAFAEPRKDGLICLESRELVESGLLGVNMPHPEITHRIGDLALLSTGSAGTSREVPGAELPRGMHGGLTENEMLVPLIIAPL